jgi:hypothetical protein
VTINGHDVVTRMFVGHIIDHPLRGPEKFWWGCKIVSGSWFIRPIIRAIVLYVAIHQAPYEHLNTERGEEGPPMHVVGCH